ncbi:HdeD family acid-resistance protein [Mycobacterium sp.]|uniref:HdeD family acid-resistance protein n=1 Tax=Mycobacterium sp. TaxID=1785 RepID=UPI003F966564
MTNDHLTAQRRAAIDAESVVLQQIWKPGLASGLLALLVGGLVLALPQASILVAATLFGVFLLGAGLAQLYFAFTLPKAASGRALLFVNGALSLVLATLSFRHFGDTYAVLLLSIWIGVGFVFQGVAETLTAISLRELPGRGWYIFGGILTWIAGLVMLTLPLHSIVVLTLVAGSWLVVLGIVQIVRALKVRGEIRRAS